MKPHQQLRRVTARHLMKMAQRLPLTDPLFNLREIAKQMVLLEDHLAHPYKLCPDCVRKHLLTIEALAEEAVSLDQMGILQGVGEQLAEQTRCWIEAYQDQAPVADLAQQVRAARKKLSPFCVDPRGPEAVERVASVWLQRGLLCPHRMAALR